MTRHFLDLDQVPAEDLRQILTSASQIKVARQGKSKLAPDTDQPLSGMVVALIFERPRDMRWIEVRVVAGPVCL